MAAPKRQVSVQNSNAAAYTQNAGARNYVAWSHYTIAVDASDLRFVDYNWCSLNAGESSNTNAFDVLGYQLQIGSTSVTVLWSGVSNKNIPINSTNIESDAILPSSFSLSKFSAGTIVMLKAIYDTGLLNGKIPASTYDKRAYTAITEQFQGYDPATCTPSSISATGSGFTATTGAFATVLNGNYRPALIGTPLIDAPSMFWEGDSQVAGQGDVNGAGNFQYGIGVAQKSTPYGSGKLMPMTNFGRPGNTIAAITGAGNSKWQPFCQYHTHFVFELGLNDANTGRSLAQIQADTMAILAIAKSYGCKTIVCTKTPITTGAWTLADGSDQTASATPTPILNALNAWYYTQVAAGLIDYVIAYGEPIRNATDSNKWKAPSITADGTHALVGGVNLQIVNVKALYDYLPYIATILTGGNDGLKVGQSLAITTGSMATLTQVSVKTLSTPAASVDFSALSAPSGSGTAVMPMWVNGGFYPFSGTVTVTATDGTKTTDTTRTLAIDDTYLEVVLSGVLHTDSHYLDFWIRAKSITPLANGDHIYWLFGNGLNFDPTSLSSCLDPMTSGIFIHRANGKIEQYNVTFAAGGNITALDIPSSIPRITSSNITSRNITQRNLTQ